MGKEEEKVKVYIYFAKEFSKQQIKKILNQLLNIKNTTIINYDIIDRNLKEDDDVKENMIYDCEVFVGVYSTYFSANLSPEDFDERFYEYKMALEDEKPCYCYIYGNEEPQRGKVSNGDNSFTNEEVHAMGIPELEDIISRIFRNMLCQNDVRGIYNTMVELDKCMETDISSFNDNKQKEILGKKAIQSFLRLANKSYWKNNVFEDKNSCDAVSSPLERLWKDFISAKGWNYEIDNIMANVIRSIKNAASKIIKDKDDKSVNYKINNINKIAISLGNEVSKQLNSHEYKKKIEMNILNAIRSSIKKLEESLEDDRSDDRGSKAERYVISSLRRTEDLIMELSYGTCFLVMGEQGSGKSYFIQTLIQEMLSAEGDEGSECKTLYVNLGCIEEEIDLEEHIRKQLVQAFDIGNGNSYGISEIIDLISMRGPYARQKIVLIIDDFDDWLNVSGRYAFDIRSLISEYSHNSNLYWIITINSQAYGAVSEGLAFWAKYSTNYRIRNIDNFYKKIIDMRSWESIYEKSAADDNWEIKGWIMLDQLNIEKKTGIQIIQNSLERHGKISNNLVYNSNNSMRFIVNPFIASIVIGLINEINIETMVDLVYMQFIEKYWNKQRSNLYRMVTESIKTKDGNQLSEREIKNTLDSSLENIADFFVYFTKGRYSLENVNEFIMSKTGKESSKYEEICNMILNTFVHTGMLKLITAKGPWEDTREYIELTFSVFWAYYISIEFIKSKEETLNNGHVVEEMESYLQSVNIQNMSKEIFQFFILNIESYAINKNMEDKFIMIILEKIIKSTNLPKDEIWYAGGKMGKSMQRSLSIILKEEYSSIVFNDSYPFIYFISECPADELNISFRLQMLQNHYKAIHDKKLEQYFLYTVKKLFKELKDCNELLICMHYFEGCEVMEITSELAGITIDTMANLVNYNKQKFMDLMIRYLLDNQEQAIPRKRMSEDDKRADSPLYFYIEWIVKVFCRHIVKRMGQGAYAFFKKNKWYKCEDINIGKAIGFVMKQQANLELGYWYQGDRNTVERNSYVDLVGSLVKSKERIDRENSVYLIRHSRVTHKQHNITVDEKFFHFLEVLYDDPTIKNTVERNEGMFMASIGSKIKSKEKKQYHNKKRNK